MTVHTRIRTKVMVTFALEPSRSCPLPGVEVARVELVEALADHRRCVR